MTWEILDRFGCPVRTLAGAKSFAVLGTESFSKGGRHDEVAHREMCLTPLLGVFFAQSDVLEEWPAKSTTPNASLRSIFSTPNGKYWRRDSLVERKATLRQMIHRLPADSHLRFADHVEGSGVALFERVCKLDLEGIVAKYKFGPYGGKDVLSTWYKIRNRAYSHLVGRAELFERDRHKKPVPGWHACELACEDAS
jgi:hypothetical protein